MRKPIISNRNSCLDNNINVFLTETETATLSEKIRNYEWEEGINWEILEPSRAKHLEPKKIVFNPKLFCSSKNPLYKHPLWLKRVSNDKNLLNGKTLSARAIGAICQSNHTTILRYQNKKPNQTEDSKKWGNYENLKVFNEDIITRLPSRLQNFINKLKIPYQKSKNPNYNILAQLIYIFNKEYDLSNVTDVSAQISNNPRYLQSILDKLKKNERNLDYQYSIDPHTYRYMRLKFYEKVPSIFNLYENHPTKKEYNHLNAELVNGLVFIFDKYLQDPRNIDMKEIDLRLNFSMRATMTLRRSQLITDFGNARITAFKLLTGIHIASPSQIFGMPFNKMNFKEYEIKSIAFKKECTEFVKNYLQGNNCENIEFVRNNDAGTNSFLMCLYSLVAFTAARHNSNHPDFKGVDYIMTLSELSEHLEYNDVRRINHQFNQGFLFASDKRPILQQKLNEEMHWAPEYFEAAFNMINQYLTFKNKSGLGHDRYYLKAKPWYSKILVDFTLGSNVINCTFYTDDELTTTPRRLGQGKYIEGAVRTHLTRDKDLRHTEKLTRIIKGSDKGIFEYQIMQTLMLQFNEHLDFIHQIRQKDNHEADKALLIIIERVKTLFEFTHIPDNMVENHSSQSLANLFLNICENRTIIFNHELIKVWEEHEFTIHISKNLTRSFRVISLNYLKQFADRLQKKRRDEVQWYSRNYKTVYNKYLELMNKVRNINEKSSEYIKWFAHFYLPQESARIEFILKHIQPQYDTWASNLFTIFKSVHFSTLY